MLVKTTDREEFHRLREAGGKCIAIIHRGALRMDEYTILTADEPEPLSRVVTATVDAPVAQEAEAVVEPTQSMDAVQEEPKPITEPVAVPKKRRGRRKVAKG